MSVTASSFYLSDATKPSQCLGTGMTGEEGYLDDTLLVDSNHNVRTVMRQA
ncbi:hypothetical protein [Wolbachia endosymbiont (group A) of Myopa testacea]|uniref:hypothetical protein n=1 Tax=Wolbachia endosymbiont (group A) of Myopa testacea TaxID=3066148 RepID=UPI003133307E